MGLCNKVLSALVSTAIFRFYDNSKDWSSKKKIEGKALLDSLRTIKQVASFKTESLHEGMGPRLNQKPGTEAGD